MSVISDTDGIKLLNEFWGCSFDSGGAHVWRIGHGDNTPLTFCSVHDEPNMTCSAPEPQGSDAVQLTWQAEHSSLRLQLLIHLNGPSLSWELSATGITAPI